MTPLSLCPEFCTDQPFLSGFLGGCVWRLKDALMAEAAVLRAHDAGCALMDCRIAETDIDGAFSLERAGFRKVETLVTLERPVSDFPALESGNCKIAIASGNADADACSAIAGKAFRFDRFHEDPFIHNSVASAIKRHWARNDVLERADRVFMALCGDKAAGFNACLISGDVAVIDLIGILPEYQGRGIGKALVGAMHNHYAKQNFTKLRLGTQEHNDGSLAFYRRLGFEAVSRNVTWHWTPAANSSGGR